MDENRRQEFAKNLAGKDIITIREIVRLGESFLGAQLQSGLAADMRAMTLAAVLAAIIAGVMGGAATVVAAKISIGFHIMPLVVFCGAMIMALRAAVHAARPTRFAFAGNNPTHWEEDGGSDEKLIIALAEQASFYAKGIEANSSVITENHRCIKKALGWVVGGILAAAGIEVVVVLTQIGRLGFAAVLGDG